VSSGDLVRRFLFENSPVRGHLAYLDTAWHAVFEHHDYSPHVLDVLGQSIAAVSLIASTRKFDGTLTLQLQGPGAMHLLVAQCTHSFGVRGVARWNSDVKPGTLLEMAGEGGRLTVTAESDDGSARYQGIVPLAGDTLSVCLESYFRDSEQLPTRIWLASTRTRAAGFLLQRLPGAVAGGTRAGRGSDEDADEAWNRIERLASTLQTEELVNLPHTELLHRLFHEEDVRVFEPAPVFFRCRCSRERVAGILTSLGPAEVRSILAERGSVEVRCEFCNRAYRFDAVDTEHLFSQSGRTHSSTLQ
jgi:molecular chaperone Hsp33